MSNVLLHPGTGMFCFVIGGILGVVMKWTGIPLLPFLFWIPLGLMLLGGLQASVSFLAWNHAINEGAKNLGVREK